MTAVQYFVIRHKPTGRFLPARVLSSKWDFDTDAFEPRLFNAASAAKRCATCWAQGIWTQAIVTEQDGWEGPSYSYADVPYPQRVEGRRREDLEVIPALLTYDHQT